MIIKPYAGKPRLYGPDIGELILARRSTSDKFIRAVVLDGRRNRDGHVRIKVHWLESDPRTVCGDVRRKRPIVANTTGFLTLVEGAPPLIKQIDKGAPGA